MKNLESTLKQIDLLLEIPNYGRLERTEIHKKPVKAEQMLRDFHLEDFAHQKELIEGGALMREREVTYKAMEGSRAVRRTAEWVQSLAAHVARLCDVNALIIMRKDDVGGLETIRFSGFDDDVQVALKCMDYIVRYLKRAVKYYKRNEEYSLYTYAVESYRLGIAEAICWHLREAYNKKQEAIKGTKAEELQKIKLSAISRFIETSPLIWYICKEPGGTKLLLAKRFAIDA